MIYTGIFQGGGIKGIAYLGALKALEERGLFCKQAAGTSAGAIVASLLVVGYNAVELINICKKTNFKNFKNPKYSLSKIIKQKGLNSTLLLEEFLNYLYIQKKVRTFGDIIFNGESKLKIIVTQLNQLKKIIIPDELFKFNQKAENYEIAKAVVMSSTIPFFYEPQKLGNKIILDGGIKENTPNVEFNISLPKIYFCFDRKKISPNELILEIKVPKYKITYFEISDEEKKNLIMIGYKAAKQFLNIYFS